MKTLIKKITFAIPGIEFLWVRLRAKPPRFSGWQMTTNAAFPSDGDFMDAHIHLLKMVLGGKFRLSQFEFEGRNLEKRLNELMWRHYIVFWAARYAPLGNFVECGACDGLTAYFALSARQGAAYLYDAWEAMKDEDLLESEKKHAGDYGYLSLEMTRKNLGMFAERVNLIKGFIPQSFVSTPGNVSLLHIDLNSSAPTTASLKEFYDKILPGGIILFDDYGWRGYEATKYAVDEFFYKKRGFFPLPTGQAIYFKS